MSEEFQYPLGPIKTTKQRLQQLEEKVDALLLGVAYLLRARIYSLDVRSEARTEAEAYHEALKQLP